MDKISDLKLGDIVVVKHSNAFGVMFYITQVIKITPKQIVVTNGTRFWKDTGKEVGTTNNYFFSQLLGKKFPLIREIRKKQAAEDLKQCIKKRIESMSILELASLWESLAPQDEG